MSCIYVCCLHVCCLHVCCLHNIVRSVVQVLVCLICSWSQPKFTNSWLIYVCSLRSLYFVQFSFYAVCSVYSFQFVRCAICVFSNLYSFSVYSILTLNTVCLCQNWMFPMTILAKCIVLRYYTMILPRELVRWFLFSRLGELMKVVVCGDKGNSFATLGMLMKPFRRQISPLLVRFLWSTNSQCLPLTSYSPCRATLCRWLILFLPATADGRTMIGLPRRFIPPPFLHLSPHYLLHPICFSLLMPLWASVSGSLTVFSCFVAMTPTTPT